MTFIVGMAIISELLCYMQNHFGKHKKNNICEAISSFFTDDEISTVRAEISKFIDGLIPKLDPKRLPRSKHKSDNSAMLICGDIYDLLAFFDTEKIVLPLLLLAICC